jgi:Lon protease-like protein
MDRMPNADGSELPEDGLRRGTGRVAEIPLFPLEVVLFPFMILPLHIFEERYKEMVNLCVRDGEPFGIVLVKGTNEVTGTVQTCSVGCTARISRVEKLHDGRMNIEVVGEHRFHILDTHEEHSYRSALTEAYEDRPYEDQIVRPLTDEVQRLLKDFLLRSLAVMGQEVSDFDLPDDPEHLSFISSCVLPVANEDKQELLVEQDIAVRLTAVREVLLQEVTRLRRAAEAQQPLVWKQLESLGYESYRCSDN